MTSEDEPYGVLESYLQRFCRKPGASPALCRVFLAALAFMRQDYPERSRNVTELAALRDAPWLENHLERLANDKLAYWLGRCSHGTPLEAALELLLDGQPSARTLEMKRGLDEGRQASFAPDSVEPPPPVPGPDVHAEAVKCLERLADLLLREMLSMEETKRQQFLSHFNAIVLVEEALLICRGRPVPEASPDPGLRRIAVEFALARLVSRLGRQEPIDGDGILRFQRRLGALGRLNRAFSDGLDRVLKRAEGYMHDPDRAEAGEAVSFPGAGDPTPIVAIMRRAREFRDYRK